MESEFTVGHRGQDFIRGKEPWSGKYVDRWFVIDPDGDCFALFRDKSKAEAQAAIYNAHPDTKKVYVLWKRATTDYGGDRGTYTVIIDGIRWHASTGNDDAANDCAKALRDAIVKHGIQTVYEIITATQRTHCVNSMAVAQSREWHEKHFTDPKPLNECEVSP